MSNLQRIKGQESILTVTLDGVIVAAINTVKNLEMTPKLSILEEDYLGETGPRFDEVWEGCGISFGMHVADPDVFDFIMSIINRAKRRDPAVQVNVKTSLRFPSGVVRKVLISDIFFGNFPFRIGGRKEYLEISVDGSAADFEIIN